MLLGRFIAFVVVALGGWFIYKVAKKYWDKAPIDEKLDNIKNLRHNATTVKSVKTKNLNKDREAIEDFLDS